LSFRRNTASTAPSLPSGKRRRCFLVLRQKSCVFIMAFRWQIGITHSKMQYIFRRAKDAYKGVFSFAYYVDAVVAL